MLGSAPDSLAGSVKKRPLVRECASREPGNLCWRGDAAEDGVAVGMAAKGGNHRAHLAGLCDKRVIERLQGFGRPGSLLV